MKNNSVGFTSNPTVEEVKAIVSHKVAGEVLFALDGEGFEPTAFGAYLINAITVANLIDQMKLWNEYPHYVIAINAYYKTDHGRETLKDIIDN